MAREIGGRGVCNERRGSGPDTSCSIGAASSPAAASTPGKRGTMMRSMLELQREGTSRATRRAPPSGTSTNSRGSIAAVYRHEADAVSHVRVGDAVDSERRRLDEADPERFRDTLADRILREPPIELQRAAREIAWVKIAEFKEASVTVGSTPPRP